MCFLMSVSVVYENFLKIVAITETLDFDWRTYLQNHNRKLKFDKSLQIEPIPLDDEFVSRWEELRVR